MAAPFYRNVSIFSPSSFLSWRPLLRRFHVRSRPCSSRSWHSWCQSGQTFFERPWKIMSNWCLDLLVGSYFAKRAVGGWKDDHGIGLEQTRSWSWAGLGRWATHGSLWSCLICFQNRFLINHHQDNLFNSLLHPIIHSFDCCFQWQSQLTLIRIRTRIGFNPVWISPWEIRHSSQD